MKKIHKLKSFELFDTFGVELEHVFMRKLHLSVQKAYWTTKSVGEQYRCSSLKNVESFTNTTLENQKLNLKNQGFLTILCIFGNCGNFLTKLVYLRK